MQDRLEAIIRLFLSWAPLRASSVFWASRSFARPFTSMARCKQTLRQMETAGLIASCQIPGIGRGQRPHAYFLRKAAGRLVAEVDDIPRSNLLFIGLGSSPWHALAIGELGSHLEAGAADVGDLQILERIRDRQFVATVELASQKVARLVPDGTLLVRRHGRFKLIFIELVNRTSVINPGATSTRRSSLARQLAKYRSFAKDVTRHPIARRLESAYGRIDGFQVLVVSTKENAAYLATAARGRQVHVLVFGPTEYSPLRKHIWKSDLATPALKMDKVADIANRPRRPLTSHTHDRYHINASPPWSHREDHTTFLPGLDTCWWVALPLPGVLRR